jgi:hypothetical protein
MRNVAIALGGLWLARAACAQAPAADEPPDLDFLEYLGSWQDDDDAWLAIEEWNKADGQRPDGPDRGAARGAPPPRAAADGGPRPGEPQRGPESRDEP